MRRALAGADADAGASVGPVVETGVDGVDGVEGELPQAWTSYY